MINRIQVVIMGNVADRSSGRKVYIDFIKIIAIYLVLFNHTQTSGWALFTITAGSALYPLYLFNAVFVKVNVPLFFMCSGALLLHKNEPYKTVLGKRFLRILIVLFISSVVYYLYFTLRIGRDPMSLKIFLKTIYTSNISSQLWFLYVYLAFLLMLPLLRRLAQSMRGRDFLWLTIAYALYRSLYIIDFLLFKGSAVHNPNFNLFVNLSYVYYPLMGYFIDRRLSEKHLKIKYLLLMILFSLAAIAASCAATHYRCTLLGEWAESQPFVETFIFVPTITVFYGIKMIFTKHPPGNILSVVFTTVGSATFGMYILEEICRIETKPIFTFLQPFIKTLPACWVWIAIACLLGFFITFLIRKIPGVSKFI